MKDKDRLALDGGEPVFERALGYGRQLIEDDDIAAVTGVLKGDYLTCGPATTAFERALCEVTGASYAVAVSNGTAALHVACLAAGIGPGDEVIVSSITFAASANCARYCGADVVFADIDPSTWEIDAADLERKITARTRAVVAVDFGGPTPDVRAIRRICDEHGLVYIEDAAHSIGTSVGGVPVGSIADITTFSFHPVKTVTCGEGGAVVTSDPELARRAELFAKHGITRDPGQLRDPYRGGWHYEQLELGYNYRMTDMQAALGSSQLAKLPRFAERRRRIVALYDERFSALEQVSYQADPHPESTVRHLYCLRFDVAALETSRRFIYDALRAEGVGVNVHYLPVYRLPYYEGLGYSQGLCPEAEAYYEQAVTLPLHCSMSDVDAEGVVRAVEKVLAGCRGRC